MGHQQVLYLLRVNVDAARDDSVGKAVSEIEITLVIHMPNIAERRPALGMVGAGGLLGVVVIGEVIAAAEINHARLACRQLVAVLVADVYLTGRRAPDRTLVLEPGGAVDDGDAVALGAGIIFVQDRPPPVDHLLLHGDRAGGGGMNGDLEA